MKNFVISYISFFDNAMQMSKITADNLADACRAFLKCEDLEGKTYEEICEYCFDCDSAIGAIEI